MRPSRYDPAANTTVNNLEFTLKCWRKHTWVAMGFNELGGGFLYNEDDAKCPECGAWDGEEPPEGVEE